MLTNCLIILPLKMHMEDEHLCENGNEKGNVEIEDTLYDSVEYEHDLEHVNVNLEHVCNEVVENRVIEIDAQHIKSSSFEFMHDVHENECEHVEELLDTITFEHEKGQVKIMYMCAMK